MPDWFTLENVASVSAIVTGLLTVLVLFLTLKTSHRLKGTDVRLDQQRKFDLMLQANHSLVTNSKATGADVDWFCYRFWNLQSDEFDEWRGGMLFDRTYRSWMETRQHDWDSNPELAPGKRHRDGWNMVKHKFEKNGFRDFIEMVIDPRQGIDAAFKKYRPGRLNRLVTWLLR